MEKIPVQDQAGFPLCYSFSATQMIQAYTTTHPPGSSPASMSPVINGISAAAESHRQGRATVETFTGARPFEIGGGAVCFTANHVRSHGSCQSRYPEDRGAHLLYQDVDVLIKNYEEEKRNRGMTQKIINNLTGKNQENIPKRTFGYLCSAEYINGPAIWKANQELASLTQAAVDQAFDADNQYSFVTVQPV